MGHYESAGAGGCGLQTAPTFSAGKPDRGCTDRVAVRRDEDVKFGRGQTEQLAIPLTSPPHLRSCLRVVTDELAFQAPGRHSSSRTRTGEERLLGEFESRDGLLTRNCREILEELR